VNLNVDENWFPQPYFALDYAFETMKKKRQNGQSEAVVWEVLIWCNLARVVRQRLSELREEDFSSVAGIARASETGKGAPPYVKARP